jgi:hypothetical protein
MSDERITTNVHQSDVLLRLMRWRARLERNHALDREAAVRLQIVARAVEEIATLRRDNDVMRQRLGALERLVHGRGPPAFGARL